MAWFHQGISALLSFRASELLPPGFCAVEASSDVDRAAVTIRAVSVNSPCPSCGAVSDRVHSRYPRRLADLPIAGRRAVPMLQARRFRCEAVLCERRIFTERFAAEASRLEHQHGAPPCDRQVRQTERISTVDPVRNRAT